MLDERSEFLALAAPLPALLRAELTEVWDIGEPEAALATLISALAEARIALPDTARGRIAVLAEAWGCWEALGGPLADCGRDASASETVELIEGTQEGARVDAAIGARIAAHNPWPGHGFVAWFACRRCADLLVRVHKTESWGPDLIASAYVILQVGEQDAEQAQTADGDDGKGHGAVGDDEPAVRPLLIRGAHHSGSPALAALVATHHRTSVGR